MDVELLSRAKIRDFERETASVRLLVAAERAQPQRRRAAPAPKPRTVRAMPSRLLRALRPSL